LKSLVGFVGAACRDPRFNASVGRGKPRLQRRDILE
jgi:hypothetical protein